MDDCDGEDGEGDDEIGQDGRDVVSVIVFKTVGGVGDQLVEVYPIQPTEEENCEERDHLDVDDATH